MQALGSQARDRPLKANHYMTNETTAPATTQVAINDIGSAEDFLAAVEKTLKFFNDGDIIEGEIVKIDRDEVLLDVGYKTEGVIPSRELSIKHDVNPDDVVNVGDQISRRRTRKVV
jgi:small subunit ribosomal protein S1